MALIPLLSSGFLCLGLIEELGTPISDFRFICDCLNFLYFILFEAVSVLLTVSAMSISAPMDFTVCLINSYQNRINILRI